MNMNRREAIGSLIGSAMIPGIKGEIRRDEYEKAREERRAKILWLNPEWIVDLLQGWKNHQFIAQTECDEIPDGCRVESVNYDWSRRAFGIWVIHPSFDSVADGSIPPNLLTYAKIQMFFKRPEDVGFQRCDPNNRKSR